MDNYDQWFEKQINYLKNKDFDNLDLENLIEELEEMGESEYKSLQSYMEILLQHFLKYNYQKTILKDPWVEKHVLHLWVESIDNSRDGIIRTLDRKPALKNRIDEVMEFAYIVAKKLAIKNMNRYVRNENQKLNTKSFPDSNPWTYNEIITEDWLPEEKYRR